MPNGVSLFNRPQEIPAKFINVLGLGTSPYLCKLLMFSPQAMGSNWSFAGDGGALAFAASAVMWIPFWIKNRK